MKLLLMSLLVVSMVGGIKECDRDRELSLEEVGRKLNFNDRFDKADHSVVTPKGVKVRSELPITQDEIRAIDEGIQEVFDRADRVGYNKNPQTRKTHNQYAVVIFRSARDTASDGTYSPDFEVLASGTSYDGTHWAHPCKDYPKFNCIWAAEQVMARGGVPHIFVGHHQKHYDRMAAAIGYGVEHEILKYENYDLYRRALTHTDTFHPLF